MMIQITDEMVLKAIDAWLDTKGGRLDSFRATLEAVADDIAAQVEPAPVVLPELTDDEIGEAWSSVDPGSCSASAITDMRVRAVLAAARAKARPETPIKVEDTAFAHHLIAKAAEGLRAPTLADVLPDIPDLGEGVWEECGYVASVDAEHHLRYVQGDSPSRFFRFVPADPEPAPWIVTPEAYDQLEQALFDIERAHRRALDVLNRTEDPHG